MRRQSPRGKQLYPWLKLWWNPLRLAWRPPGFDGFPVVLGLHPTTWMY